MDMVGHDGADAMPLKRTVAREEISRRRRQMALLTYDMSAAMMMVCGYTQRTLLSRRFTKSAQHFVAASHRIVCSGTVVIPAHYIHTTTAGTSPDIRQ